MRHRSTRATSDVDLTDLTLRPALINAHDHLELNHFPRTKFRDRYANAHEWGEDVSRRLDDEPYRALRGLPLTDRLFSGALKNLLCGALIVVQHNPPHRALFQRDFPVRVVRRYRWAHSLHFTPPAAVRRAYRGARLRRIPFYIHIGEGVDAVAADELPRLAALLGPDLSQVVVIHGVGLRMEDILRYAPHVRGLVICPTTNRFLLGALPDAAAWVAAGGRIALGSDSRLTADGDLLDELRAAHDAFGDLPWRPDMTAGVRVPPGDQVALRADVPLTQARRADLALVMRSGRPLIGDPDVMARFRRTPTVRARLDGVEKALDARLARQIARCAIREPGLELLEPP